MRRFTGGVPETACGVGSTLAKTENLRAKLPDLLRDLRICTLVDVPCGDHNWMSKVDLGEVNYIGLDANEEMLIKSRSRAPGRHFGKLDVLKDSFVFTDGILCRDFLQHLPNSLVARVLRRFSSCKWLFATSHSNLINGDIVKVGDFRPLNLMAAPFNFPLPWFSIDDPKFSGRVIGAWPGWCLDLGR